jgi:hypothetical protein
VKYTARLAEADQEIFEYFCIENEQFHSRTLTDPTAKPSAVRKIEDLL